MSLTEQQKAYHLRKMRTRVARLDVNKDGVITREDYILTSERMATYGKLTEEQAKEVREGLMKLADIMNLDKGVQLSPAKLSETLLSKTPEQRKAMIQHSHGPLYDVIDTNSDGHISVGEFKVYLKAIAPEVTEEEAEHAFNMIDADKNGEISRDEFFTAAEDFFFGVEETELSRVFLGKLKD